MIVVPNKFPAKPAPRRIAIIGEAPGTHEVHWHRCLQCGHGFATEWRDQSGHHKVEHCTQCFSRDIVADPTPFVGPSGWLLNKLLAEVGIEREACFVGNCCQVQPPGNDITRFKWQGEEIQSGLLQLLRDLQIYQPHFVLLLGNTPLRAFANDRKRNIGDWRGSLFMSDFLVTHTGADDHSTQGKLVKCMATYHPAALLREAGLTREARADIRRAAEESRTDELVVPVDKITTSDSVKWLVARLKIIQMDHLRIAVDIEGGCGGVSCIGFATSSNEAFVVPFIKADGTSYWSDPEDEVALWQAVSDVLEDPLVPKVLQNYLYDAFVLAWSYGILIRGLADDIMLKHFELSPEAEKSLGYQTSIYTKHPFYKFERKSDDERVQLTYCGKDCCRTFECNVAQDKLLMPKQREHYEFNVKLLAPLLYMELRGIRYDKDEAQRRLAATQKRIYALQDRINREAAASRPALAAFYTALEGWGTSGELVADRNGATANIITILAESFCLARRTERRTVTETSYAPHFWNGKKWVKKGKRLSAEAVQAKVAEGWWQGSNAPTLSASDCQGKVAAKARPVAGGEAGDSQVAQGNGQRAGDGAGGGQSGAAGDKVQWWLKPVVKQVERNVQVEVATFEDVRRFAKDSCNAECRRAIQIAGGVSGKARGGACHLTPAQRGELATLLGIHVKLNASGRKKDKVADDGTTQRGDEKDANWLLYDCWKLPPQFKKERGNKRTTDLSSDMEALLTIWSKTKDRRALWFLSWRRLDTRRETLEADTDADGRIRCGYNVAGTETVRLACYESPTGSGYNLQTVAEQDRDLFIADEGCDIGSIDLRGADSWSVAARAAMQGDSRMLDDLKAGRKIQTIVALCYQQGADAINRLPPAQLDALCRAFDEKQFIYKGCKMVIYGSSYGMGAPTMATNLLKQSYKKDGRPVWIEPKLCKSIQEKAFFVRYWGVPQWQQESLRKLKETGSFTTCAGHRRLFYGRKDDHKTLGEYLCEEAQFNTTYATKLGLLKLWMDPENRRNDGTLRIEPLHSVHDSLNPQWRVEDREFARRKILPEYFNNDIYVGTIKLVIPASGTYGGSWGEQEYNL